MQDQTRLKKRYSPEVRRGMILEEAAKLVTTEGVAGLSMERISKQAGVSKSLIYRYFESLTDLLQKLLDKEMRALRRAQINAVEEANTFEQLVRNITHAYIEFISERGMIISRLQSEPSISDMHDPTQYGRKASVDYLAHFVVKHFDLPIEVAKAATDISYGLPAAAGEYLLKHETEPKEVEDITVSMIIGTFTALRNDYVVRMKSLERQI